jgi:hypothetical protein
VTRAFPRKKKGLCIIKNVPIVEARMAVALATVIRDGLVEIGRLRLTEAARGTKAQELFDYIVSDKFRTRFADVAESVASLREHQHCARSQEVKYDQWCAGLLRQHSGRADSS